MGKIVVSSNVTLDGVIQDPDGKEGFKHGGWFKQFVGNDFEGWAKNETEETLHAEAMLLGRKSDEWFATRTPGRTEPWAERMNSLPKYVVSSTLKKPKWTNSTVLKDVVKEVSKLKQEVGGDILVYGSYQLVRSAHRASPRRRIPTGRLPGRPWSWRATLRRDHGQDATAPRPQPDHR